MEAKEDELREGRGRGRKSKEGWKGGRNAGV